MIFNSQSPYRELARSLDALPNRFPPAEDEAELRLLAKIFTEAEADLAAHLLAEPETAAQISERLGRDPRETGALLKAMVQKGQIAMGKTAAGRLGFRLMPFVIGIYEAQVDRIDTELAGLFEAYYQQAFGRALSVQPQFHRVIPIGESVKNPLEVRPFESAAGLVEHAQAWGVIDCICRKQKALIGQACQHPLDVCMILSSRAGAFDGSSTIRVLTQAEALHTLQRAARAGLVHCVSNNQAELYYICNCCTCSCGILRGMAELGIANAVAHSAYVNQANDALCAACGECVEACMFGALSLDITIAVNETRCVGCGVCVPVCPENALGLVHRAGENDPPADEAAWRAARDAARA